ncbi:MAG: hypothetical protein AMXMBFR47_12490 [Planctomycetota bacterium]
MNKPNTAVRTALVLVAATAALLATGCLERKETIRVGRDGSVKMLMTIKGEPSDFESGDALPQRGSPWKVEEDRIESEPDKNDVRVRVASFDGRKGEPIPDSFVDERDPNYETCLRFPTTVNVERRSDGEYFHFNRRYLARQEARYAIWNEPLKQSIDKFAGKDPADMTDEERRELVGTLRAAESMKRAEMVLGAVETMEEEQKWPQDYGLRLRRVVLDTYENVNMDDIVTLMGSPAGEDRDTAINAFGAELVEKVGERMRKELRELHVSSGDAERFFDAYAAEEARRSATEDLMDETFRVELELPGDVVAHNATSVEDGKLIWEFPGKSLADRDHVIMATSRISRK